MAKYLLWDERIAERTVGITLVPGPYEKHVTGSYGKDDGILMEQEKLWEVRTDNMYLNIMYDEEDKLFKLWYSPFVRFQRQPWGRECALCYATSNDGLHWDKPVLNLAPFNGSTANNIIARAVHGPGVRKDPHDPDPARRYKMIYLHEPWTFSEVEPNRPIPKEKSVRVAFSPDGLHWTWPDNGQALFRDAPIGDTHNNAFWDERSKKYVAFTRMWSPTRVVARMESDDFLHWSEPQIVLRPLPDEENLHQPYAMPVFPFESLYVGMVMIFHSQPDEDTVDLELAISTVTKNWRRPFPGKPLIQRGGQWTFDSHVIFGPSSPIIRDDKMWIYYAGCNGPHTSIRETGLGLAKFRIDGFAACQAKTDATIVTRPIECTGKALTANVDCAKGRLLVAILTPEGKPYPGFELENCREIKTDSINAEITWKNKVNLAELAGKPIKVHFHVCYGSIYSFSLT